KSGRTSSTEASLKRRARWRGKLPNQSAGPDCDRLSLSKLGNCPRQGAATQGFCLAFRRKHPSQLNGLGLDRPCGHHFEEFARDMRQGSGAGRCHRYLGWVVLGVSNELRKYFGRDRWVNHHDQGRADDAGNWRNVTDEIVIELLV